MICGGDRLSSVQFSLLRLLSVTHTERLDLAPLVAHLANEHRGASRRRLRQLADRLNSGTPLVAALEQTPDALNDEDVLTLRFASQSGLVSAALEALVEQAAAESRRVSFRIRQAVVYFSCVFLVVALVTCFLMLFVAPTYQSLADDFGWDLEENVAGLVALVNCLGMMARYFPFGILLLLVLLGLLWVLKPFRLFRRAIASRLVEPVAQLRSAHLLRMLSLATDAGRPLPGSLSTLARYHFDRNVRAGLLYARNEVEQGAEAWTSLSTARLLTEKEATALAESPTTRTRTWLMRRLAGWKEEQVRHRSDVWSSLVHPAIVLLFGAFVLWVALAFMGFLSELIFLLA